jgi:peptidoglycan/xylan/chitin deacetylase (PgdA/CDA1 family)
MLEQGCRLRDPRRLGHSQHVRAGTLVLLLLMLAGRESAGTRLAPVLTEAPSGCREIALTFDLCPVREGTGWDRALVTMLEQRHVPATFFASGRWIERHDAEVRELLDNPLFELGTHGMRHRHLPKLDLAGQQEEILGPVDLLNTDYHYRPRLVRAPYGEFDDRTRAIIADHGLELVQWSVVSGDPDPHLGADAILRTMRAGVRDGSVVIFHANGKGAHTRQVVETVVADLLPARGLKPVTVSQLVRGCRHDGGG